jgi:hypothetical protein
VYTPLLNTKDEFVNIAKKKYLNEEDIVIISFINEIIDDIVSGSNSAYVLFDNIISLDPFEDINARTGELLMNYGKGIIFEGDTLCYGKYMEPLKDNQVKIEIRNAILMKYLETVEVSEE